MQSYHQWCDNYHLYKPSLASIIMGVQPMPTGLIYHLYANNSQKLSSYADWLRKYEAANAVV